jgi:hypothetical protein
MKGASVDTMALAVEGSAVVMIGVSRAYKESSNCRMEAQYALQKKKPLIPLMLTPGYEADGWLGLLLGTSIWYGFYGDALSSGSGFDARMDSLCREIGSRGRADASHHADVPEPAPVADSSSEAASSAALRAELQPLKLTALRKRALAEGIAKAAVEEAMDANDDPKEALRVLIVEMQRSRGPRDRILTCLQGGGEPAAEMVRGVLEHASDVLDEHTASSPRKARKALVFLLERMEAASELVDAAWCDGLCQREQEGKPDVDLLDELCAALALWEGMAPSSRELSTRATELLDCLGELGLLSAEAPAAAAEGGA